MLWEAAGGVVKLESNAPPTITDDSLGVSTLLEVVEKHMMIEKLLCEDHGEYDKCGVK